MTPIAAYYVMVATDREVARQPRHQFTVPRRSLVERVAGVLESLFSLGRPTSAQPI